MGEHSGETRCCLTCGRWGNCAFRPADDGAEGWVCTNDRACARRAARLTPPTSGRES